MLPAAQIQLWRMNFKPLKTPLYCYSRQGGGALSDPLLHGLDDEGRHGEHLLEGNSTGCEPLI